MASTVLDTLNITRTLLNDDAGLQWHDMVLFPKVVLAHQELVAKLVLNGVPALYEFTTRATIAIGQLDMGDDFPTNVERPIDMTEWNVNDATSNGVPMTKVDFIPYLDQDSFLRFWAWIQQKIMFLGATTIRQVALRYMGNVPVPTQVTDELFFNLSEMFIGPRVAALVMSGKPEYQTFNAIAEDNLSKLVRIEVKALQSLPVRKKPFSYTIKRRGRVGVAI